MPGRTLGALNLGILAVALVAGSTQPGKAELSSHQLQGVSEAVALPADQAVLALRTLFAANLPDLVELAEEAARQVPALSARIMEEGVRASPSDAGDLAAAIIAIAPESREAIARALVIDVAPSPSLGAPAPSGTAADTAESADGDVASPTRL